MSRGRLARVPRVSARQLPIGPVPIDTGTVELVRVSGDPSGVTVYVNGAESSHLDLADPGRLEFEYMQQMMAAIDATLPPGTPLRAVHLGAAACSLARAVEARRPGSRQIAVEIDGALAAHVRQWFALPRAPRLRIRVGDARDALSALRPGSQHVVVRDVFSGRSVPAHLRTREMLREVARVLDPSGIYVLNCADVPPLLDTRREVATLVTTFPHVGVITDPAVLKGRRYGNLVLLARADPLPVDTLARSLRALAFPASILSDDDAARFAGSAPPFVDPPPPA
jgi:spermidine synthase